MFCYILYQLHEVIRVGSFKLKTASSYLCSTHSSAINVHQLQPKSATLIVAYKNLHTIVVVSLACLLGYMLDFNFDRHSGYGNTLSRTIRSTYFANYSQAGPRKLQGASKFSVGCASVFAMVSMTAGAMRMIDFTLDSIFKSNLLQARRYFQCLN